MAIAARPTTYAGIPMRSRLEATFAANMDRWGVAWRYEPCAFGAPGMGQWLPDFALALSSQHVLVEVKGSLTGSEAEGGRQTRRRSLMTRMAVAWESDPDLVLAIVEDQWAIVESNPRPGSIWAGTVRGWGPAIFGGCPLLGGDRGIYWLDATGRPSSRPSCCDRPEPGYLNPLWRAS